MFVQLHVPVSVDDTLDKVWSHLEANMPPDSSVQIPFHVCRIFAVGPKMSQQTFVTSICMRSLRGGLQTLDRMHLGLYEHELGFKVHFKQVLGSHAV